MEDIITALSRMHWLFVIARNSSFTYKGKSSDVRQVARELGVRYVLEGSMRKAGDRVRITAQLIDGGNGNHIWAERYDRQVVDIFAVQDDITRNVISHRTSAPCHREPAHSEQATGEARCVGMSHTKPVAPRAIQQE